MTQTPMTAEQCRELDVKIALKRGWKWLSAKKLALFRQCMNEE